MMFVFVLFWSSGSFEFDLVDLFVLALRLFCEWFLLLAVAFSYFGWIVLMILWIWYWFVLCFGDFGVVAILLV